MAASRLLWVQSRALARGALAAASLRSRRRCAALWLEDFSGLKTFLNLFFYYFFLAELTGRAPGKLNTTPKQFRTLNPPNANHGGLTVLEPPDRVLGR